MPGLHRQPLLQTPYDTPDVMITYPRQKYLFHELAYPTALAFQPSDWRCLRRSIEQTTGIEPAFPTWEAGVLPITPYLHPGRFATHRSRAPKTCGRYAVTACRATPPALPICKETALWRVRDLNSQTFSLQSCCATIAPTPLTCSRCGVTCVFGLWPLQPRRLLYTIRLPYLLASGIVILSEVSRTLSDHPGATRLMALWTRIELIPMTTRSSCYPLHHQSIVRIAHHCKP